MAAGPGRSFGFLNPDIQATSWKLTAVAIAIACLCVASYIEIPMVPVPITAQTYVLLTIAGLLGWKLGTISTVLWLALGALGLPVLAGGTGGLERFAGPTAGYLFAFPFAVAAVGLLAQRGWYAKNVALAFVTMIMGHVICLGFGGLWLAFTIGPASALVKGVFPFLIGGVIKSALVVATLIIADRLPGNKHTR